MGIKDQMDLADSILDKIKIIDPSAIVAGGAPRDWYFGKEASDIDVFFHFRNDLQIWRIKKSLESLGFVFDSINDGANLPEFYKKNPNLRCVFNVSSDETPVQLMLMGKSTYECVVDEFPLSICQVWYAHGRIGKHRNFVEGVDSRSIKLVNKLYAGGDSYVQKILKKYPDWRFVEGWETAK